MQAHTLLEGKLGFQSGKGGQQPGASSAVIQGGLGGRVQHQTGWGVDSPAMPTAGEGWSKSMATQLIWRVQEDISKGEVVRQSDW